ncbi:hypothetical protein AB0F43_31240 [Kribbella sp. NPDC023972]|uniref:hypothetical protein n=1 Tax=Kribbella sp. NPDC023972 TaxID=3154795 RepID=UPI003402196A
MSDDRLDFLSDNGESAVNAARIGPGQFLLDVESVQVGFVFALEGRRFRVISAPVVLTKNNYLATVREVHGPDAGRQLTVQLLLGRLR